MPKFRKKPVVIEAMQFDGSWESVRALVEAHEAVTWSSRDGGIVRIATLEGEMIGSAGDWIIQGVQGELYPCKPEIFAATYEKVPDLVTPEEAAARVSGRA